MTRSGLSKNAIEVRVLVALCIFVLCAILVAGLWPFHAPLNEVSWLTNANGLRFGRYATILSSGAFATPSSQDEEFCSIEIWLRPHRDLQISDSPGWQAGFYRPRAKHWETDATQAVVIRTDAGRGV